MPNKNYLAGRRLEYESKKRWEEKGYTVARSSGSHGVWDLCAVRQNAPVALVQCKVVTSKASAALLIKRFKAAPPFLADKHFHQILEVKVKGSTAIHTTIV